MKNTAILTLICSLLIPAASFAATETVTAQVLQTGIDSHGTSFELSYVDSTTVEHRRWYKAPVSKTDEMLALAVWAFTRGGLVRVELDPTQTEEALGSRPEVSSMIITFGDEAN